MKIHYKLILGFLAVALLVEGQTSKEALEKLEIEEKTKLKCMEKEKGG